MRLLLKIILPVLVLAACGAVAYVTVANRAPPERRPVPVAVTEVQAAPVERSSYQVRLETRGTVRPRTESTLIPEVAGRVVELSAKLRPGEFFETGDLLLVIDPRDYQAEVVIAESNLAQVQMQLAEEQARSAQAERDWRRLGERGEADTLALRKPQLASARAAVASAQARLGQTRLNVERTRITAPYVGRVLEQMVDVGQYVAPGTVLARVYAVDYVEVRLPLTNRQLEFVQVPERYRGEDAARRPDGPAVRLAARIGSRQHFWDGRIVRAAGSLDAESRQLFLVAQVDNPYGKRPESRPPLKVGQFVEATIAGRVLEDVIVIPRETLHAGDTVRLVDAESRIEERQVDVIWSDAEVAVIGGGLEPGERLVHTPLGPGMTGAEVRVQGDIPAEGQTSERGRGRKPPRPNAPPGA